MRILDIFKNPATGNVSHSKLWANIACAAGTVKFVMLPDPSAAINKQDLNLWIAQNIKS